MDMSSKPNSTDAGEMYETDMSFKYGERDQNIPASETETAKGPVEPTSSVAVAPETAPDYSVDQMVAQQEDADSEFDDIDEGDVIDGNIYELAEQRELSGTPGAEVANEIKNQPGHFWDRRKRFQEGVKRAELRITTRQARLQEQEAKKAEELRQEIEMWGRQGADAVPFLEGPVEAAILSFAISSTMALRAGAKLAFTGFTSAAEAMVAAVVSAPIENLNESLSKRYGVLSLPISIVLGAIVGGGLESSGSRVAGTLAKTLTKKSKDVRNKIRQVTERNLSRGQDTLSATHNAVGSVAKTDRQGVNALFDEVGGVVERRINEIAEENRARFESGKPAPELSDAENVHKSNANAVLNDAGIDAGDPGKPGRLAARLTEETTTDSSAVGVSNQVGARPGETITSAISRSSSDKTFLNHVDDIGGYYLNQHDVKVVYEFAAGHTQSWGTEPSILIKYDGSIPAASLRATAAEQAKFLKQEGMAIFQSHPRGPDIYHEITFSKSLAPDLEALGGKLNDAGIEFSTIYEKDGSVVVVLFDQLGEKQDNVINLLDSIVPKNQHKDLFLTGRAQDAQYKRTRGAVEFDGGEDIASAAKRYDTIIQENAPSSGAEQYRSGAFGRAVRGGNIPEPPTAAPGTQIPGDISRAAHVPARGPGVKPEEITAATAKSGELKKNSKVVSRLAALGAVSFVRTKSGTMGRRTFNAFMSDRQQGWDALPKASKDFVFEQAKLNYGNVAKTSLLHSMKNSKSLERVIDLWRTGEFRADWYEDALDELHEVFGDDAELFAGFIAASSPLEKVAPNVDKALTLYVQYKTGKPFDVKLGESVYPNANRLIKAWDGGRGKISGSVIKGQKVINFLDNILGDPNAVTIDTWMGRVFGFPIGTGRSLYAHEIDFIEQAIRTMAADAGVSPREMQAGLWVGQKLSDEGLGTVVDSLSDVIRQRVDNAKAAMGAENPTVLANMVAPQRPTDPPSLVADFRSFVLGPAIAKIMYQDKEDDKGKFSDEVVEQVALTLGIDIKNPDQTVEVAGAISILRKLIGDVSQTAEEIAANQRRNLNKLTNNRAKRKYRRGILKEYSEHDSSQTRVRGLGAMTAWYARRKSAATRGVRPMSQTLEAAERIKYTPEYIERILPGSSMNAEEIVALVGTVVDFASGPFNASVLRALKSGTDADFKEVMVNFRTLGEFVTTEAGVVAEAGRALQILNEPTAALRNYLKQIDGIFNSPDATSEITRERLLRMMLELKTPEEMMYMATKISKPGWSGVFIEFWMGALLSGPTTQMANILSNTVMAVKTPVEYLVAGIVPGSGVNYREGYERLVGLVGSLKDAMKVFARTLKTGTPGSGVGGEKFYEQTKAFTARNIVPGSEGKITGKVVDAVGEWVVRGPFRGLLAADELFKVLNYRSALRGDAFAVALSEGHKGKELHKRMMELFNDPTPGMVKKAGALAKKNTFQDELGEVGKLIGDLSNAHPIMKVVMPFIKVPINAMKESTDLTPLALLKNSFYKELTSGDPARRSIAMTKMAMGSTFMSYMAILAMEGSITGNGPSDPGLRKTWLMTHRPVAINLGDDPKTGKRRWLEVGRLEPIGSLVGMVADAVQVWGFMDEVTATKFTTGLMAILAKNFTSKNFTKGLAGALQAGENPERYAEGFVERMIASLIPNISRQANRVLFDTQVKDLRNLVDRVKASVPGMSGDVPPLYDGEGNPIMTPTGIFPFSPIYVQAQKNDPVALEMLRLRLGFNSISDRLNGIELTRDEYQKLQMSFLKGKDESTGLTMWKKIGLLIRTEAYNSAAQTDENRKLTVQNIISAYKMRARYMLRTDQKLGPGLEERLAKERVTTAEGASRPKRSARGEASLVGGFDR